MSEASEPVGSVEVALGHAARLLESSPVLAAEQASEILKAVPAYPPAMLLLGVARRAGGDSAAALAVLGPLAAMHPQWALAHYELALALSALDRSAASIAALQQAVTLKPDMTDAWRALGDELLNAGDAAGADSAYARSIKASTKDERLLSAAARASAEAPNRRRCVAHAGRGRSAVASLHRRRNPAVALSRTGAELHCRSPPTRHHPAPSK